MLGLLHEVRLALREAHREGDTLGVRVEQLALLHACSGLGLGLG